MGRITNFVQTHPRLERGVRVAAAAALYTGVAELLFNLEPQRADPAALFIFGAVAAPSVAVLLALPDLDLRTCIANGIVALVALPLYAELMCDCLPPEPNNTVPPGSAFIGLLIFSSLGGFLMLVVVVWWIAVRLKHGELWAEKQW